MSDQDKTTPKPERDIPVRKKEPDPLRRIEESEKDKSQKQRHINPPTPWPKKSK
ncbi:MAG: hypothetical protein HQL01_11815 [Nitrospirae bacterium]|nr:hypothetical protein [Nitrospirota bacterium]